MEVSINLSPDLMSGLRKRRRLEQHHAATLAELDWLECVERPRLEGLYNESIGQWESERLQWDCKVRKLREELTRIGTCQPGMPEAELRSVLQAINNEFRSVERCVRDLADTVSASLRHPAYLTPVDTTSEQQLCALYREWISTLLRCARAERSTGVSVAGEWRIKGRHLLGELDAGGIRDLVTQLQASQRSTGMVMTSAALQAGLEQMRAQVLDGLRAIDASRRTFPHDQAELLADASWSNRRRQFIQREIRLLKQEFKQLSDERARMINRLSAA